MTTQSDLLEQRLSRQELIALKNRRAGLFIFQLSWIMVFICLMIVHWQIRAQAPSWPPPGVEKLGVLLPTLMTGGLIASSLLARRGLRALRADRAGTFFSSWRAAIALGVVFVLVMAFEWLSVPVSGQYSNLFRVLVGFHGVHALAVGAYMVHVYRQGRAGAYDAVNFWPVEAAAGLWYFVTIAWILFYAVLYWS